MQEKLSSSVIKALTPGPKPFEVVDTQIKGFLVRVQPSGRMTYYYSYRAPSGMRKRIKLGVAGSELTPAQARDAALQRAAEVAKGVDVQRAKQVAKVAALEARQRTLQTFITEQYRPWVMSSLKTAESTLERIKYHFDDFMGLAIEDISVRRVEAWRTAALRKGMAPATVNRTVNCLRGVLTKAVEWDWLPSHPLDRLKPLRMDKSPKARYLSDAEEKSLYQALAERDEKLKAARARGNKHRAARGYPLLPDLGEVAYPDRMTPLVVLSLKTGLRRGEIFDLRIGDVSLEGGYLTVRGEDAKSGHTRHIPLSPKASEVLTAWLLQRGGEPGERVFPSDDGGRLDNVRNSWSSILADAGITAFRWHDMRHDFASRLVMRGVPLNTVRDLCGHADLNTTLRYAHLAPDHKSSAVALIG
tara:strand:+ start:7786 stop:9033 length:1248 start_codon:yes stop_codon:yes gene_type:complete